MEGLGARHAGREGAVTPALRCDIDCAQGEAGLPQHVLGDQCVEERHKLGRRVLQVERVAAGRDDGGLRELKAKVKVEGHLSLDLGAQAGRGHCLQCGDDLRPGGRRQRRDVAGAQRLGEGHPSNGEAVGGGQQPRHFIEVPLPQQVCELFHSVAAVLRQDRVRPLAGHAGRTRAAWAQPAAGAGRQLRAAVELPRTGLLAVACRSGCPNPRVRAAWPRLAG
mmetsp:Transcript_41774/g.121055  ORF Transcript_41774/g.121055 Transcript_41774/m.121055 type:complete len:222 (+) Transcript_41774:894-1559(+)